MLKASVFVLQETLISCSLRAETAENQIQNFILAELQCRLNSQPCRMMAVKVRALIGKEQDPVSWNRDVVKLGIWRP